MRSSVNYFLSFQSQLYFDVFRLERRKNLSGPLFGRDFCCCDVRYPTLKIQNEDQHHGFDFSERGGRKKVRRASLNHHLDTNSGCPPCCIYRGTDEVILILCRGEKLCSRSRKCGKADKNSRKCNAQRERHAFWSHSSVIISKNLKRRAEESCGVMIQECKSKAVRLDEKEAEITLREREFKQREEQAERLARESGRESVK